MTDGSIIIKQEAAEMSSNSESVFFGEAEILMSLVGHWRDRTKGKKLSLIQHIGKHFLTAVFIFINLIVSYSIVADFECRTKVTEYIFNLIHDVLALGVTKLLNSEETNKLIDFIHDYDTKCLDQETPNAKEIYIKTRRENKTMVRGFIIIAIAAATLWFCTGVR